MVTKAKCSTQGCERDVFSKGMCSGCYGKEWRLARREARAMVVPVAPAVEPRQLTSGVTDDELTAIEGEIIHDEQVKVPETHLVATSPLEMQAAQGDLRAHLEQKLAVIEREIVEANAALSEARRNGWATTALTSARNRLVDDETYYNKILAAVEAGHQIIPEFPVEVFAVRRSEPDKRERHTWTGPVNHQNNWLHKPVEADCAPAGAGEYRNPLPDVQVWNGFPTRDPQGKEYTPFNVERSGRPVGPMVFPSMTARSPIMRATAAVMKDKVFDQIGVCHPVVPAPAERRIRMNAGKAGDPLVIGQVLHKRVGSKQKVASFIIAWHLNLNDL